MSNATMTQDLNESKRSVGDRLQFLIREYGLLTAAGFVALLAVSAEGRQPEPPELAERRKAIEALSADERQQLQANLLAWNGETSEERANARGFVQTLETDPELNMTLKKYREWLETISGQAKTELLAIRDPKARAEKVVSLRDAQLQKAKPGDPRFNNHRPTLDRLMRIMSSALQVPEPQSKNDPEQKLAFELSVVEAMRQRQDGFRSIDRETLDKIIAELRPGFGRERPDKQRPPETPFFLMHLLLSGVIDDAERLVGGPISDAERAKLMKSLPATERQRFGELDGEMKRARLIAISLTQKNSELGGRFTRLIDSMEEGRRRNGFDPQRQAPPFDRGPVDRGPNDRGPNEGRLNDRGPGPPPDDAGNPPRRNGPRGDRPQQP